MNSIGKVLRPLYVLIYGRRHEATDKRLLSEKRGQLHRNDEFLMTFDRLCPQYDCRQFFCVKADAEGFSAVSVPPTIQLGPVLADDRARIRNKDCAVVANQYLSKERSSFLLGRLHYWDEWVASRPSVPKIYHSGDWE